MDTKSERFELRLTLKEATALREIATFHKMSMSRIVVELIKEEAELPCLFA